MICPNKKNRSCRREVYNGYNYGQNGCKSGHKNERILKNENFKFISITKFVCNNYCLIIEKYNEYDCYIGEVLDLSTSLPAEQETSIYWLLIDIISGKGDI